MPLNADPTGSVEFDEDTGTMTDEDVVEVVDGVVVPVVAPLIVPLVVVVVVLVVTPAPGAGVNTGADAEPVGNAAVVDGCAAGAVEGAAAGAVAEAGAGNVSASASCA